MSLENFHVASIEAPALEELQSLGQELGVVLVAVEPDPQPATLDAEQLARLQALEQRMGKVVLAYTGQ